MQKQAGRARAATLQSPWLTSLGVGQQRPGEEAVLNDMWRILQARLSYLVEASYNTLPSPRNLHLWYDAESSQNPNLQHILSGYMAALTHGRYGWRQDQILRKLVELLKAKRLEANRAIPETSQKQIHFVKQRDETQSGTSKSWSLVSPGDQSNLRAKP